MCEHTQFSAMVVVNRITESEDDPTIVGLSADIKIKCSDCGICFDFIGLPGGISGSYPTVSFLGNELRCPIQPSVLGVYDHKVL